MTAQTTPAVSVIIPVRDHFHLLERLLDTLTAHAPSGTPWEIMVVDDGSREPVAPLAERYGARSIRFETSRGPAHARNAGAAATSGEVLFFFDADVEYAAGGVETAMALFTSQPETGGVSFLNQPYDARDNTVKNFGAALEYFWWGTRFEAGQDHYGCRGFTTRNGAVRRTCFDAIHGFDTTFQTNAHEDYDFGKRLAAHCPCVMARTPIFYHNFPATLRRVMRNYWVRITLWVPYFLQHRPPMDEAQISSNEARLRMVALAPAPLLTIAALPFPYAPWAAVGAAGCVAVYGMGISAFLRHAWQWSGSARFTAAAGAIHYLTSWVIAVGGAWALLRYKIAAQRGPVLPAENEPQNHP